jgi:hypothetical protein
MVYQLGARYAAISHISGNEVEVGSRKSSLTSLISDRVPVDLISSIIKQKIVFFVEQSLFYRLK